MDIINYDNFTDNDLNNKFINAQPIPHIQILNFLEKDFFLKFQEIEIDKQKKKSGIYFNSVVEEKKWISKNTNLPNLTQKLINELNSEKFNQTLKKITGMKDLFSTTVGNTDLANYHEMEPGGLLGPHVDHASDPKSKLPHVLNIVVYLTKDWDLKWGGGTDFYDFKGKKIISEVPYIPNSAILFLHTPYSFHGVRRISNEANKVRKSLYVDYYSFNLDPYKNFKLNFKNHWFDHGTNFIMTNPIDLFRKKNLLYLKIKIEYFFNKIFN